ncbi:hypothetical protein [Eisenbergiella porci]|uniref:hypothetical protein n=1 Tax=Eisenbergiella porci TaxID=2652274 RepID=UPI002A805CBC|nr:hypothetical protein [Eisenbergiella porci]
MEAKKIVAVVGAIDVVLLVVCLVLYLGKDRKGPEIFFDEKKQIEYAEGMDEALLLEGVTAVDEKDGDVSDSLLVEKVAGTNGKEVIVTYVARDDANNVGKASRAFTVVGSYGGGDLLPVEEETFETGDMPGTEGDTETEAETNEEENSGEEEGQDENQGEGNNEGEPAGPNPVLVLNADVIETKKGVAPNWNEVIETMSDDKDDYNTLYNNLKLEGQVKLNEEGEYPVTLYTVDSDGNRSEVRNLVVKVI